MNLSADDSVVFLAVCTHGNFQQAGDALGIAGTTVGRRITQLEDRLGTSLFVRSTRYLELTEAGRTYRDRCTPMLAALESAENAVRALMSRPAGHLRVAAPGGIIQAIVGDVGIDFIAQNPGVTLDIVGSLENQVPDGDTLHLAVWSSDGVPPFDAIQRTVGRIDMCLVASAEWAERNSVETLDDLADHACVVLGASRKSARVTFQTPDGPRAIDLNCGLFTTSIWLTRQAAVRGLGPAGLPRSATQHLLDAGVLVELLPDVRILPAPIRLVYANRNPPYRLTAFIDAIVDALQAYTLPEGSPR